MVIQEVEKRLLKEIIAEEGNEGFLRIEDRVNAEIQEERAVISPGGSVVYCENAMRHYKETGMIVYLHTSYETINNRLHNAKNRGVVLKDGQTLKDLYEERTALFERYADLMISEEGRDLEETIEEVLRVLENGLNVTK